MANRLGDKNGNPQNADPKLWNHVITPTTKFWKSLTSNPQLGILDRRSKDYQKQFLLMAV